MAIEVGQKVTGKVTGITNFGAFVDLGDNQTGLVHISEVSDKYVKDVHDVLTEGDEVTVKVLSVGDDGKIGLSIRKAVDRPQQNRHEHDHHRGGQTRGGAFRGRKRSGGNKDFDSMMANFLKESESRLATIKHNTEGKRGGRGGRRS
ncbi:MULTISPECIES: S1 domain-containing RNA-binding protein [unclassified Ligilactobacillus]|uniref:S1 domain-containing RNA-binding protein n=1 Tax=unclassified Ligilactobacillus TaxID=2767920 RepID=UPI003853DEDB